MCTYYSCAVFQCTSTSIKTPEKLFIYVPQKEDMRKKWLKLARRDAKKFSAKSGIYFCEDHFNLPTDMANYMQYKIMGSVRKVLMVKGCLPSKFECYKKRISTNIPRSAVVKRQKLEQSRECERILAESRRNELKRQETIKQVEGQNNSTGIEETSEPNIKIKIEPEEERTEAVLLTNFTNTSIFKVKEEPKEPEELSNVYVEDFIWLDDVKVELPSVETESDCHTSDYLGNENVECEIEIMPDIEVKEEFEQIEFISFPNVEFESNHYSNCNFNEEYTKLEVKQKTSTERVRRFREKQRQLKQQESQQKGTHGGSRPGSRRRKRTKTPKTTAERCQEYRQRIKENHDCFIQKTVYLQIQSV